MSDIHKPVLIIIAGPNGSGKTSVTSKILRHEWMENAIYINPDIIAQEKFGDWNSKEAIIQSVKYCETLREDCLKNKTSLIFETVLSAEDKINYILRAHHAGFFIIANSSIVSKFVDRAYIYDNSIDNAEARLLFRLSDGHLIKQYIENIPLWARFLLPSA